MIYGILSRLGRVRFTVGYVAVLLAVSSALIVLGPQARAVIIQHASTNLHNLARGHLGTLLGSALVVDAGPLYFWLPFLTCMLVLAELHLRTIRLFVAFVVGHIGATLLVAAALAAAVELRWLPLSVTRASDVGMSYGALAVLGAMTAVIPRRWRMAWVGWWVAAAIASAIVGGDFTDAGHTVAVVLGVLVSSRFRQPIYWTPARSMMLVASSGFGFLLLAHHWATMAAAPVFGALGAVLAYKIDQMVTARRAVLVPAPDVARPVASG
ncbi:rhomboid-like protein [Mycobacterium helveticum]|uniref:rhomboid-like protein n=1 Tax=Mycobacterium helveticum TaxID=2592811 RepID=UPI001FEBAC75|nr:rhomboid-like protein [Mycobacterium helveticum]